MATFYSTEVTTIVFPPFRTETQAVLCGEPAGEDTTELTVEVMGTTDLVLEAVEVYSVQMWDAGVCTFTWPPLTWYVLWIVGRELSTLLAFQIFELSIFFG